MVMPGMSTFSPTDGFQKFKFGNKDKDNDRYQSVVVDNYKFPEQGKYDKDEEQFEDNLEHLPVDNIDVQNKLNLPAHKDSEFSSADEMIFEQDDTLLKQSTNEDEDGSEKVMSLQDQLMQSGSISVSSETNNTKYSSNTTSTDNNTTTTENNNDETAKTTESEKEDEQQLTVDINQQQETRGRGLTTGLGAEGDFTRQLFAPGARSPES
eukprot:UN29237